MLKRSGKPRRYMSPSFKDKVRERDAFTCRICLTHVNELKEQLQVHHIRPVEMGGRDRLNNLISLCNCCHKSVHENIEAYIPELRTYVQLLKDTGKHFVIRLEGKL